MFKTPFCVSLMLDAKNKKYVAHQEHNKGLNAATTSSWCISRSRIGEQWAWSIYRQSEDSLWTRGPIGTCEHNKKSHSWYIYIYNIKFCHAALEVSFAKLPVVPQKVSSSATAPWVAGLSPSWGDKYRSKHRKLVRCLASSVAPARATGTAKIARIATLLPSLSGSVVLFCIILHMTHGCSQMTSHVLLKVGWQCKLDSL